MFVGPKLSAWVNSHTYLINLLKGGRAMNNTHHIKNGQVSAYIKLLAGCLIPIVSIFACEAAGVEYYSIGGFIPYLMLLFCPIAYLMMEYPKVSKDRIINTLKDKLRQ
jgi:hypothetical protein